MRVVLTGGTNINSLLGHSNTGLLFNMPSLLLMKRVGLGCCTVLCVVAATSPLPAADLDVAAEYQAITKRFHQALAAAKGRSLESHKERNAAIADLLRRAAAANSTEHILLTKMARIAQLPEACTRHARLAIEQHPRDRVDLVECYAALLWGLGRQQNFEELEQAVAAARREPIHDRSLYGMHVSISRDYAEFDRPDAAAEHLGHALRCHTRLTRTEPKYIEQMDPFDTLEKMCVFGIEAAREQRLLETIDELLATLGGGASDRLVKFQQQLHQKQVMLLHRIGRTDEADRLIASIRDAAERRVQEAPTEEASLLDLANAMQLQVTTYGLRRPEAISEYLSFFDKHVREPSRSRAFYESALSAYVQVIVLHRDAGDLTAAEDAANRFQSAFSTLQLSDFTRDTVARAKSLADQYLVELAADRHRNALIGRPYKMFDDPVWLQGPPIESTELMGKVVVFSFWSTFHSPRQLALEQLQRWHQRYAADGLMVIGIARRLPFDWDDQTKRTKYVAGLSPEKSDDAARTFLRHHGIEFRAAVVDPAFFKEYGVRQLPQYVVVDRQGVVRRISLNLADERGAAVEAEIRKLLGLAPEGTHR
jgi:thiol-disulfide isomerase/thioredoxin